MDEAPDFDSTRHTRRRLTVLSPAATPGRVVAQLANGVRVRLPFWRWAWPGRLSVAGVRVVVGP
ncbi:hypothetical protein AB0B45_20900 [Nonomuraea sp. NPDC049152]|uniref:hypothetical protein n=1 Tax=Nonomuraea sp. NPDC049152 TaxID=3154350 RepID=UPI0033ECDEDE